MNYDLTPIITRLTPFQNPGTAVAGVDVCFGPIMIRAKLCKGQNGFFLSWPAKKNENSGKWFDEIAIADPVLRLKAQDAALREYQRQAEGELAEVW